MTSVKYMLTVSRCLLLSNSPPPFNDVYTRTIHFYSLYARLHEEKLPRTRTNILYSSYTCSRRSYTDNQPPSPHLYLRTKAPWNGPFADRESRVDFQGWGAGWGPDDSAVASPTGVRPRVAEGDGPPLVSHGPLSGDDSRTPTVVSHGPLHSRVTEGDRSSYDVGSPTTPTDVPFGSSDWA